MKMNKKGLKNLGIIAGITGLSFFGCKENSNNNENIEEKVKKETHFQGNFESLDNFNDDVILIACYDNKEYQGVLETLHSRNRLRSLRGKMSFTDREGYKKVKVPNRQKDGTISNSYIHIVKKNNLPQILDKMEEKNIKYDIVQMRGHQHKPMRELYSMTQDCTKDNAIYFFGGCNSYNLASKKSSSKKPAIGGPGTQESARNTFYLLKMIDFIDTEGINSWNDLRSELNESDSQFRNFYFPKD